MRVLYLISGLCILAAVILWLGSLRIVRRTWAAAGAFILVLLSGGLLLAAVLPQNSFYGPTVAKVNTKEKVVALTFDDGPYAPYTQQLLKVLAEKKVKATFFLVGDNVRENQETVRLISQEQHEIALHADRHIDSLKLSQKELEQNILQGKELLEKITGQQVNYMRPPHGFRDWQLMDIAGKADLKIINWSVIPRDWTNPGTEVIAQRVCQDVFPGAIVLLHDGDSPKKTASREQTVKAVSVIIDKLRSEGYRFVMVSELLKYKE